jgi:hypothetical protein
MIIIGLTPFLEGMDWSFANEDSDSKYFSEEDITEYILYSFLLPAAGNWANSRITKYLEEA